MQLLKPILKRLLIFVLCYVVLTLFFQIPVVRDASANLFSKGADGFISLFLPKGYLHVEPGQGAELERLSVVRVLFGNQQRVDEQMELARKSGQATTGLDLKEFQIKLEEFFGIALYFFLALLVITPVGWQRKLAGAGWGLLLLLLFAFLKLLCYALYNYTHFPTGVYELTGGASVLVDAVYDYVKMGANILIATLVWVLVAFRFSEWKKTLSSLAGT